ncbi:MAG TPA: EF-hand domain-containing protein [Actinophytocola sp.]|jgi:Ca2+-binding EF-hand superfamily protein|uniref:EF-hand domain-containing protein n=1 Tax=Actinophytocola sp. TaxID=1872138 RepID=UPI002E0503F7|nr:EF-hand domain-containing protein [Actinophytocola sp.]
MPTQLQRRKFEKLFERLDADHDGKVDQSDIDALVQGWCATVNAAPGSGKWRQITASANTMWQEVQQRFSVKAGTAVTRDQWVAAHDDPTFVDDVAIPMAMAAFELGDAEGEGKVSFARWMAGQTVSGLNQAEAAELFRQLDRNGDGYVTKEEYAQAISEFYKSDDQGAVGNLMAGQL